MTLAVKLIFIAKYRSFIPPEIFNKIVLTLLWQCCFPVWHCGSMAKVAMQWQ